MTEHIKCPKCNTLVPNNWDVCMECGFKVEAFHQDYQPQTHVKKQPAYPPAQCLRCDGQMVSVGELKFHESSRAWPFILGEIGELMVNRQCFEGFVCQQCGKTELFIPKK